jgi:hypothetical protein
MGYGNQGVLGLNPTKRPTYRTKNMPIATGKRPQSPQIRVIALQQNKRENETTKKVQGETNAT